MSTLFAANMDDNNACKNFLDTKIAEFGDFKYAYMILNKKNLMETWVTTNYPSEWVEIYRENNYQYIDPVVQSALKRVSPFPWNKNIKISSLINSSEIFNHSKHYGILNGYTFVVHDNNHNLAMLSLMIKNTESVDIETKIHHRKADLQMLLVSIHDKFTARLRAATLHKYYQPLEQNNSLSVRENEVLYWASMGKTYQEIAIIIGVKSRTVKFHIGNIVKKMGVTNAKHAIRLGAELQLVKPVPR